MAKFVIYLGGNFLDKRIINSIKKNGFKVVLVDKNNSSPCIEYCDLFIQNDIRSKEAILEEIILKLSNFKIVAILESGEFAIETAAFLRSKLNIHGLQFKDYKRVINKIYQKKFFNKFGIRNPSYKELSMQKIKEINSQDLSYPIVIKIPASYGGKSVWICRDEKDFHNSIENICSIDFQGKILIEDYILGKEIAISGFFDSNQIYDLTIFKVKRKASTAQLEYGILVDQKKEIKLSDLCYKLLLKIARKFNYEGGLLSANLISCEDRTYCIEFTSVTSQLLLNAQELFLNRNLITDYLSRENKSLGRIFINTKDLTFCFQQLFNNDPLFKDIPDINLTQENLNSHNLKNLVFFRDLNSKNLHHNQVINLAVIFAISKEVHEISKDLEKYKAIISRLIKSK